MPELKDALSATEIAALQVPGWPTGKFRMRQRLDLEGCPSRKRVGRGGGREYLISGLPAPIQAAYAQSIMRSSTAGAMPAVPGGSEPSAGFFIPDACDETSAQLFDARPEKTKARARKALAATQNYFALIAIGIRPNAAAAAAAEKYQRSVSTLRRDIGLVRLKAEHLWLDVLADDYPGRTACAEMSAEAWEVLKADFLRRERPGAEACIARLKRAAKGRDWVIPSNRTLQRRLKNLPRALSVYAREGASAAQQLYPAQQRDKSALHALQIINGDGYKHNLWVLFPDGEVIRAKTWFWQDVYSSRILGFRTDKTEHTDMIRLSFGDIVENYGIPDKVLLDNTLAAANKAMSGGVKHRFRFKVRADEPLGVFPLINTAIIWATPGHGQAKPIERFNGIGGAGEIIDKAPELAGAWTGGSALDKPDYDGKTRAIPVAQLEAVIAREIAHYNAQAGRSGAMQRGRSFDEVFAESYAAAPIRRATGAQRRLWLLATEPVRASARDGAITLDAGRAPGMPNRYWDNELVDYAGKQIVARFDPKRLHEGVHIYSCDGRYICFAACIEAKGFDDQGAAREHARARNQFKRATRDQLAATRRMTVIEAAEAYAGTAPPMIPAPARGKVVRGEFRDPLERLPLPVTQETPEEVAERVALAAEMAKDNVKPPRTADDEWAPIRRHNNMAQRVAAGESLGEEEHAWFESYLRSSDYRTFSMLAVDFPEKLKETK